MKKRKMGRPPSEWQYLLAKMKVKSDEFYSFDELAEKLQTTTTAIAAYCARYKVSGQYILSDAGGVKKKVSLQSLKNAAENSVASYLE